MSTDVMKMPVEMASCSTEQEAIRWTRRVDGTYVKKGTIPANAPTVRVFVIDEDETNPDSICSGLKLWSREEAVALVERKIAEGSYKAWRYEIRPDISNEEAPAGPNVAQPANTAVCICSNPRCKKGPNDTRGLVTGRRAKYCCNYCRVDVSRRSRQKSEQNEELKRKRRRDAKYASHAERQRAYQAKHSTSQLPQVIKDLLWMKARRPRVPDSGVQEPA